LRFTALPSGAGDSNFYAQIGSSTKNGGDWAGGGGRDIGNGLTFAPTENPFFLYVVRLVVPSGKNFSNLIVKPMLTTDLSATYDSFVKYSGNEERLNEQIVNLHESSKGATVNLLNPTLKETTVVGDMTCTPNGDGTYTFDGTATSSRNFFPLTVGEGYKMESGVTYHLSGCPEGGSPTTYELIAEAELGTTYKKQYAHDYGNGVSFTVPQADIDAGYRLRITMSIRSNVKNLVFKPMLTTDLSADYNSFVRYSGSGKKLNEQVANLYDNSKGTIVNLLNYNFETATKNGITITNNGDGTYILKGTASAYTNFMVLPYTKGIKVKKGQYKLVGCPKGGGAQKYNIWMCESSHGSDIDNLVEDYGDGAICNFEGAKSIHIEIRVFGGTALPSNGITFKPMLTTDLNATYDDYVQYSGDGRLNENVAEIYTNVERLTKSVGSTNTNNVFIWKTYTGKADEEGVFIIQNVSGYVPIFCLIESPARNALDVCKGILYNNVSKTFAIDTYMSNKTVTIKVLYVKDS